MNRVFIIPLLALLTLVSCATSPFLVKTSSTHYGPDGPWQAITISLGSPGQPLDIYPGGVYASVILSQQVCSKFPSRTCNADNLFDPSRSASLDNTSIMYGHQSRGGDFGTGAINYSSLNDAVMDTLNLPGGNLGQGATISNLSVHLYSSLNMTYPDGTVYPPPQLGYLPLGPAGNQTFSDNNEITVNASIVPGALKEQGKTDTASFGLHIGSAAFNIPLSLYFGGYDVSRLSGPVSTQQVNKDFAFQIDLFDVGIGVSYGGSPFSYASRQSILSESNSSITGALPVIMDPTTPYLNLPDSTCKAITRDLPVTYQPKYGLYFWNTADPRYKQIVTSPSYLSFTFRASVSTSENITINVPFQLLNLTFDEPLVSTPTPYFPCQPPQAGGKYSLGRAFLQAAFIGANWDVQTFGEWYLAQAPGPNVPSSPSQIPFGSTVSSSPSNSWNGSWDGHWTPLPLASGQTPQTPSSGGGGGLSGGAKAGIAVGVVAVALIAIGAAVFVVRKQRKIHVQSAAPSQEWAMLDQNGTEGKTRKYSEGWIPGHGYQPGEEYKDVQDQPSQIYEAPGSGPAELAGGRDLGHELPNSPRGARSRHN